MGEKLVREALEYVKTPDALTTPERMALVRLATGADDVTRQCADIMLDGTLDQLITKGALEIRNEGLFFTSMTLADAYKAYRVMSGVEEVNQ